MELTKELMNYIKKVCTSEDMETYVLEKVIEKLDTLNEKSIKGFIYYRKKNFNRDNFQITKMYGRKYYKDEFMKSSQKEKNTILNNAPQVLDINGCLDIQENKNTKLTEVELKEIIELIKKELKEEEFKLLELFYIERYEQKKICKILNISNISVLKTKISRIKQKLRKNKDLRFIYNNLNM